MKPPGMEPPADDPEEADPGLARERTELAWTRTAVSFAAVGAAILSYHPVAGLTVLVLGTVVWWLGRLPGIAGTGSGHDRRLLLITVTINGIGLAALLLGFLGRGITSFP